MLGCCVKVSDISIDVFSRIFLLFSLSFDGFDQDDKNGLQAAMLVLLLVIIIINQP